MTPTFFGVMGLTNQLKNSCGKPWVLFSVMLHFQNELITGNYWNILSNYHVYT